jgi:hypothetical protein
MSTSFLQLDQCLELRTSTFCLEEKISMRNKDPPTVVENRYLIKITSIETAKASSLVLPACKKKNTKAPSLTPKPFIEMGKTSVRYMRGTTT